MKKKNFILSTLLFLFISILGFAVENPNSLKLRDCCKIKISIPK